MHSHSQVGHEASLGRGAANLDQNTCQVVQAGPTTTGLIQIGMPQPVDILFNGWHSAQQACFPLPLPVLLPAIPPGVQGNCSAALVRLHTIDDSSSCSAPGLLATGVWPMQARPARGSLLQALAAAPCGCGTQAHHCHCIANAIRTQQDKTLVAPDYAPVYYKLCSTASMRSPPATRPNLSYSHEALSCQQAIHTRSYALCGALCTATIAGWLEAPQLGGQPMAGCHSTPLTAVDGHCGHQALLNTQLGQPGARGLGDCACARWWGKQCPSTAAPSQPSCAHGLLYSTHRGWGPEHSLGTRSLAATAWLQASMCCSGSYVLCATITLECIPLHTLCHTLTHRDWVCREQW